MGNRQRGKVSKSKHRPLHESPPKSPFKFMSKTPAVDRPFNRDKLPIREKPDYRGIQERRPGMAKRQKARPSEKAPFDTSNNDFFTELLTAQLNGQRLLMGKPMLEI